MNTTLQSHCPAGANSGKPKRKPGIAKALLKSSSVFMHSAINTHNQLNVELRYEQVSIDIITAWEKAMKAYLHKKKVKILLANGRTSDFFDCLKAVSKEIGSSFLAASKNLELLYQYRNNAQHFYAEEWDALLFGLATESITQYRKFLEDQCSYPFLKGRDLLIMPIGFNHPVKPEDFLSDQSATKNASKEVKAFLKQLSDAGATLQAQGNQDSVLVLFHIALENVKKTTDADLVVRVDNSNPKAAIMAVHRPINGEIKIVGHSTAQIVQLNEQELFDAGWNISYAQIKDFMRCSIPHQKMNSNFNKVMAKIKGDKTIC
ncbi:MAG: hypothetical protein EOO07_10795, partial [Chitinophagaceae bacterium]